MTIFKKNADTVTVKLPFIDWQIFSKCFMYLTREK